MTSDITRILQGYLEGTYTSLEAIQLLVATSGEVDLDQFWASMPNWFKKEIRPVLDAGGADRADGGAIYFWNGNCAKLMHSWARMSSWWRALRCSVIDRPRIPVDFNEMVEPDLVLLSRTGVRTDSTGASVTLRAGDQVFIYSDDNDDQGRPDPLIAMGWVEVDRHEQGWSKHVPWRCRFSDEGVRPLSEVDEV
jgi:hypothetical protein